MRSKQLTRLGDFLSGASSTVLIFAVADFRWWLLVVGLLLAAIGCQLPSVELEFLRSLSIYLSI
jgi:hypothetical protein